MSQSALTATPRYGSIFPLKTSQKTRNLYFLSSPGMYLGRVTTFLPSMMSFFLTTAR